MPEILTRAGKGSDLTPTEADTNFKATVRQVTTTATVLTSDNRGTVEGNHATTPFTITLPTVATAAGVDTGDFFTTITNIGAAVVSVDGNGSETINGSTTALTLNQYSSVRVELNSAKTGWQTTADVGNATNLINTATLETETATTSGTTHDYTGLPSWVTKVTFTMVDVSLATFGQDLELVLGDSGGFETTGYTNIIYDLSADSVGPTDAFRLTASSDNASSYIIHGELVKHDASNTWVIKSTAVEDSAGANPLTCIGDKSLTGALTQIRLQSSGGSAFDAGSFNIRYS